MNLLCVLYMQVTRDRYPKEVEEKMFTVEFEQEEIRIAIPTEGMVTKEGWRIVAPSHTLRVSCIATISLILNTFVLFPLHLAWGFDTSENLGML